MADETQKAPYSLAHTARKHGETSMTIEAAPPAPTSFTDSDTQTRYVPQDIPAKGGTVSPNPNATAKSAKDRTRDVSTT